MRICRACARSVSSGRLRGTDEILHLVKVKPDVAEGHADVFVTSIVPYTFEPYVPGDWRPPYVPPLYVAHGEVCAHG